MTTLEEQKNLAVLASYLLCAGDDNNLWVRRAGNLFGTALTAACQIKRDPGREDLREFLIFDVLEKSKLSLSGRALALVQNYLRSLPQYKEGLADTQDETVLDNHGYLQMQFTRIIYDMEQLSNITTELLRDKEREGSARLTREITIPLELIFFKKHGMDIFKNPKFNFASKKSFLESFLKLDVCAEGLLGPERTLRAIHLFSRVDTHVLDALKSGLGISLNSTSSQSVWDTALRARSIVSAWEDKRVLQDGLGQFLHKDKLRVTRL